jgi:hypothetical protein
MQYYWPSSIPGSSTENSSSEGANPDQNSFHHIFHHRTVEVMARRAPWILRGMARLAPAADRR